MFLFISKNNYFISSFQPAIIVCLLMMAAFVTMVTETDGKPANEYEYVEGVEPLYKTKFRSVPRPFDRRTPCCPAKACHLGCSCCN